MPQSHSGPATKVPRNPFDAVLGLGSNIGDRVGNIEDAIARLTADGVIKLVARSRYYRTAPWGVTDQDWFVNACIAVKADVSARELLARCQAVENGMARVRTQRWGPRNIDVDVLTFRDQKIVEPDLVVPHPRIAERAFVLVPLKDVAPDIRIDGASIDEMLSRLDASDVQPLAGA
ncbi:2-amino-4-hydroxy-6-hydroxymethyldihydropteridine pyrophosphokinase [Hyphomicrobium denitrificans ATCC 51888]|uniref:2-amino-4-hydroxy-6-hydroxymethyldihydropteridine pyrophosphokinase n=1 Tax=Hyphomicrobium denitrificans (strain ATCC 51888 / DSM 1869 / NCIMB 11706 / TK 0415) TaxID=582899 RepID=D8JXT5_HYPDA|nr:2-amino-4-hydroxy-6-hydroxymethyldihydropteridine diphosphokinase [Hyphomicrobium denitrificans]ADJ23294.1 2-amino-4-hydroxy-6-hydroxymethyldihydropteridine pyrophosphokinase [Hyphomicrobium denitrificans ATCC 51888]